MPDSAIRGLNIQNIVRLAEMAPLESEELTDLLEHALNESYPESPQSLREQIARRRKDQEILRSLTGNKILGGETTDEAAAD